MLIDLRLYKMGLFESIFGGANEQASSIFGDNTTTSAYQSYTAGYKQGIANASSQQQAYNNMLAQSQAYQYQQPTWVFNGKECTLKEFTEAIFPDDKEAQLLFILKHGGV